MKDLSRSTRLRMQCRRLSEHWVAQIENHRGLILRGIFIILPLYLLLYAGNFVGDLSEQEIVIFRMGAVLAIVVAGLLWTCLSVINSFVPLKPTELKPNQSDLEDIDYISESLGVSVHRVGDTPLNVFPRPPQNAEEERLIRLVYEYSAKGFVFVDKQGNLIGRAVYLPSKANRVKQNRAKMKLTQPPAKKP